MLVGVGAAVTLSACASMAPGYERPASPVPASVGEQSGDRSTLLSWRDVFVDPALRALIEEALLNNRDLRVAALNVERARALHRIQRAESFPAIGASADYFRQRTGENAISRGLGAPVGAGPSIFEQYSVNAGVSAYELDLFGRVRSLNREALERYFAVDGTRKAAAIALIAEVANAYLRLAADRELLGLAGETFESRRQSLDLTIELVENGLGNGLDVERARTLVERARADAAALKAQVARDENALRLLVGASAPTSVHAVDAIAEVELRRAAPTGVRSDILLGRPDILSAEHLLRAANANIGAARAAFFPRILLTASAGTASADLDDLFSAGTGVWSFAPSISVPIFTGGRNRASLAGAKIDRDIAAAQYEGAIQTAFREVADALATRRTIGERVEATENLANAAARTFDLADARFRNGVDDYLAVLDAQREDYTARQELVGARLAEAANVIELYRALGGDGAEAAADDSP